MMSNQHDAVLWCASYTIIAVSYALIHRNTVYLYPHFITTYLISSLFTTVIMFLHLLISKQIPSAFFSKVLLFSPILLFTWLLYFTHFNALQFINQHTVDMVFNLRVFLVLPIEAALTHRHFSKTNVFSVILIVTAFILCSTKETQFAPRGHYWIFLYLCIYIIQIVYLKWIMNIYELTAHEMAFYSSIMVSFVLYCIVSRFDSASDAHHDLLTVTSMAILLHCITSLSMIKIHFTCLNHFTLTAYTVLDIMKHVPSTIASSLLFSDHISLFQLGGFLLSLIGTILYIQSSQKNTNEKEISLGVLSFLVEPLLNRFNRISHV